MARLNIFAVGLVLAVALNFVHCSNDEIKSNIEVVTVPSLAKYLQENPGAKIQPMIKETKEVGVKPIIQSTYRIGQRIAGDRLLTTKPTERQTYQTPRIARANLYYPQSGPGNAVITYLEIHVDKSSNLGSAVVVSGGIGQRQIAVVIEAQQTYWFAYSAAIYGY